GSPVLRAIRRAHESWLRVTRSDIPLAQGELRRTPQSSVTRIEFPELEPMAGGVVPPAPTFSWLDNPFPPDAWRARLRFHSLEWLAQLLDAAERTSDPRHLVDVRELIARWLKECLYREHHPHINLWDDHITALRAIALCKAWTAFRANDPADPLMQDLAYALVRHARKLALEALYRARHNHGD